MSPTQVPAALRRLVGERAGGRCEYCLVPEQMTLAAHEVAHAAAATSFRCPRILSPLPPTPRIFASKKV